MTSPQQQIIEKCKEVVAKAKVLYPHLAAALDNVRISFDLKGRSAGQARGTGWGLNARYTVRFNRDMLTREAFDHVLNNTVPHEYAHIVCFMDKTLGSNHDSGWANVCVKLGGTSKRTHSEAVVFGKGYTYQFVTDRGHKVQIGDKHFKYLQLVGFLEFRKGKGTIRKEDEYRIIGHSGRTLANPVIRNAKPAGVASAFDSVVKPAVIDDFDDMKYDDTFMPVPEFEGETVPTPTVDTSKFAVSPITPLPAAPKTIAVAPKPAIVAAKPVVVNIDALPVHGESKAATSRRIMATFHAQGKSYEEIIAAMIAANGYNRQLARATYKANYQKAGVPAG
jgi:predicted SprT family Zn-dependent metalloprotease